MSFQAMALPFILLIGKLIGRVIFHSSSWQHRDLFRLVIAPGATGFTALGYTTGRALHRLSISTEKGGTIMYEILLLMLAASMVRYPL